MNCNQESSLENFKEKGLRNLDSVDKTDFALKFRKRLKG